MEREFVLKRGRGTKYAHTVCYANNFLPFYPYNICDWSIKWIEYECAFSTIHRLTVGLIIVWFLVSSLFKWVQTFCAIVVEFAVNFNMYGNLKTFFIYSYRNSFKTYNWIFVLRYLFSFNIDDASIINRF